FSIGKTEEGREMIAVAVANEKLIAGMDANRERLARLADPRTIKLDDAEAEKLVQTSTPVYYLTGTIHSPETGAPTALRSSPTVSPSTTAPTSKRSATT